VQCHELQRSWRRRRNVHHVSRPNQSGKDGFFIACDRIGTVSYTPCGRSSSVQEQRKIHRQMLQHLSGEIHWISVKHSGHQGGYAFQLQNSGKVALSYGYGWVGEARTVRQWPVTESLLWSSSGKELWRHDYIGLHGGFSHDQSNKMIQCTEMKRGVRNLLRGWLVSKGGTGPSMAGWPVQSAVFAPEWPSRDNMSSWSGERESRRGTLIDASHGPLGL
jgi:hypothetical protein